MNTEKEIKKQRKLIEKKASEFNRIAISINSMNEDFEGEDRPPILPCVRILSNGSTEFYNCKTGEAIP